ncbi:MAG: T9SS type A sorting domain-containing protein [Bacteroidales bacterium]|nr:T9SS type A sorting domain-containing protein [Bacteroidales bacterium]
MSYNKLFSFTFILLFVSSIYAQPGNGIGNETKQQYDDEQIVLSGDDLINSIELSENVVVNGKEIELADGALEGGVMFKSQSSTEPFNQGLPSWNGFAEENLDASFKIQMRFKTSDGWQRWVTLGFWDKEIWDNYGYTKFTGGIVYTDNVKVYTYIKEFQFQVLFKRNDLNTPAPSIKQLSFVVSDSRTTANLNITEIVADNPPAIYYDTEHIYQYGVDDAIGGRICSPSSTAMCLISLGIDVDPYDFAVKTRDPYFDIFGDWPRNVQHAHMHGVEGKVTRYRTWSEAYDVLENGGRIAMSLGKPLYGGHLIMLAGFDDTGNPILHDPGSKYGYKRQYNKTDISKSWFNKGGISYTFYLEDENLVNENFGSNLGNTKIYPNPTSDYFTIEVSNETKLTLINNIGQTIMSANIFGKADIDVSNLEKGMYVIQLQDKAGNNSVKKIIIE